MKHLTVVDRMSLAQQLESMRRQVLNELLEAAPNAFAQSSLNASRKVRAWADEAEAEREDDVRLAEIEVERQRLQDIEQAQQRFADGRYGVCAACGEDIPRERLLALPVAIRCAACQTRFEGRTR